MNFLIVENSLSLHTCIDPIEVSIHFKLSIHSFQDPNFFNVTRSFQRMYPGILEQNVSLIHAS